eukprot:comp21807_c0_seq1/m.31045 comp21807_c0_seq1/g.31045  ORF comp21807_c0_seq1/g.31045 comp21807_c0_seq1/m.31045 type:complete len:431 (-) comp21807_c0_seq1:688-1980(-)
MGARQEDKHLSENEEMDVDDQKTIDEEYKVWRKNAPYLYDRLMTKTLDWPSLTVQWLPGTSTSFSATETEEEKTFSDGTVQTLLLGTNTSGQETDFLIICEVHVPYVGALENVAEAPTAGKPKGQHRIVQQIAHPGEVNRARYMPQDPNIIATHGNEGLVHVFDCTKHANEQKGTDPSPQLKLSGHTQEGYALSWNPQHRGRLLSGAYDQTVCLWETENANGPKLAPTRIFTGHTDNVEDVAWHPTKADIFASVGDDRRLLIWDTRQGSTSRAVHTVDAHEDCVNCVAFNPNVDFLLCTGSSDKTVALWDTRNLSRALHSLQAHTDGVYSVQWSPLVEGVLASGGDDRRVTVWDVRKIGEEQTAEEAEDGSPEVVFQHGGHKSAVKDLGWSHVDPWLCGSVDENNQLHCWQLAKKIISDEEANVDPSDLE